MAKDVAETLKGMLAKNMNLSEQQAEEYVFQLKVCCDVQGVLSSLTEWVAEVFKVTLKILWAAMSFFLAECIRKRA